MKNILRTAIFFVYLWGNVPFLFAQESCYEQYFREHNKEIFPAIDENDDSYDELKKMALARQIMYNGSAMVSSETERADQYAPSNGMFQPLLLAIDTVTGICHLLSEDGAVLASAHIAMVDSTWYMWLSVDPLADKNIANTPYMYCNGNPIMLIDPDGREPSPEEAAWMSEYAYGGNKDYLKKIEDKLGESGWSLSAVGQSIERDCSANGFQSALFERTKGGKTEYAYAFAGTDPKSLLDIAADVGQVWGLSSQYNTAIHNAKALSKELGTLELTFVGHSLGGGEATAASMATGRLAITFNPAAVSLATIVRGCLINAPNVVNYVAKGDPLTIGQIVGNPILSMKFHSPLLVLPGQTFTTPKIAGNAHQMANFLNTTLPQR